MHRYVIKRLILIVPILLGVSFIVFFIMRNIPLDVFDLLRPPPRNAAAMLNLLFRQ